MKTENGLIQNRKKLKKAKRVFVKRISKFDIESKKYLSKLQEISSVESLEVYNIYDLVGENIEQALQKASWILADPVTDQIFGELSPKGSWIAIEPLPGQFSQRNDSAKQCFELVGFGNITINSGKIFLFNRLDKNELNAIKKYLINPLESREKDMNVLFDNPLPKSVFSPQIIDKFIEMDSFELQNLHDKFSFSMGLDDLEHIKKYFKQKGSNPTETELKVLDTYWSDHCRHTTFETEISSVYLENIDNSPVEKTWKFYLKLREELGIQKPIRLMDIATIMGKYFQKKGLVNNIDTSQEINACSISIQVDEDGAEETWLLQFKNETHNHPTEVEPFGGASTCIGGAIRDPLSGRAFVYQAMRVSGAANPCESLDETLDGKLPQKTISVLAAEGYSSYGNQIGISTTHVREIYHSGYKAKRLEIGFVIGAVKKSWVKREIPKPGDIILLVGGKTGRDGIGGATGSSKVNDNKKIEELSSEVQKGNAPEERKIQRLFRNEKVIRLIKRCNDFGAGGVSVAIGEIAQGVHIELDKVPLKYDGLNATEIALSESQERMAIVIDKKDKDSFIAFAREENLNATQVATVIDEKKMKMTWNGITFVEIDRSFIDTNGVRKSVSAKVDSYEKEIYSENKFSKQNLLNLLSSLNHTSQRGLIEQFDSHVGRSTVLMPLGGKFQMTPEDVSVQKLPTKGFTNTVSIASYGFIPNISDKNPYLGSYYAVIESVSKLVAAGGEVHNIRLSFQEYFKKLGEDPKNWGQPLTALLGALEAQKTLKIPAIGGKDSMSGSYKDIHVPPTLVSFGIVPSKSQNVRTASLPISDKLNIYVLIPKRKQDGLFSSSSLINSYLWLGKEKRIISAMAIKSGGIAETLILMSLGNRIGLCIETDLDLMNFYPGAIVFSTVEKLDYKKDITLIGTTNLNSKIVLNNIQITFNEILENYTQTLESIFPTKVQDKKNTIISKSTQQNIKPKLKYSGKITKPRVFIPVFPGTNSEYDTEKAFILAGGKCTQRVFKNFRFELIEESINEFSAQIVKSNIIVFPGGFSAGDEPDGSAKYIVAILKNKKIKDSIENFLLNDGLILGLCNGFQALIKSGLLPYGKIRERRSNSPTLTFNSIQRHISRLVKIEVVNDSSPWLTNQRGNQYWIPISHFEGRFVCNLNTYNELSASGQIATQYIDFNGNTTQEIPYNPNGSFQAVEGITSRCGKIYGRMGHPERYELGLMKNIPEICAHNIFDNAIQYFK